MKYSSFLLAAIVISSSLSAQEPGSSRPEKVKHYTVSGYRHGVSHFPRMELKGAEYKAGEALTFDRYHSEEVFNEWMQRWAEKYPDLVELYEAGETFEGRPVRQMTLTNRKTGKDTDKPAAYFEGGRHSGEVTSSECVLFMAKYLLDNYGKDPVVTKILDTKTIYLRPVNNPDGQNMYLKTAQSNRSTVRPVDNDNDGLLDEDSPEDLDGDGLILTMRWKDEKKGTMIPDPGDPSGRIMKRVEEGKGVYMTASEGIDNDGDGRINEDGIGGLDLHRNYPENWRPQSEATGRGFTQGGAGEFPLSETETRSVVSFLLAHPNVSVVNSMDTSVPMHLRPPSTSGSDERMYPEDLEWYKLFDRIGKEKTGYERAGDVYNDYGSGNPLFGHGPDFGYWYYGAIWYGDELWNGARYKDYNGDGRKDQLDQIMWDDEENDSSGFHPWKPAKHPVYGDIEIGGFDPKFFSQNPPPKHLESWVRNQAMFNLEMVKHLPELEWEDIEVKRIKTWKADSSDYQVKVSFRNTGKLPTALRQAHLVKIVREDIVRIDLDTAGISMNSVPYRLIEEKKEEPRDDRGRFGDPGRARPRTSFTSQTGHTQGGAKTTATFVLRLYGSNGLKGKASVISTRGGILKDREFTVR